MIATRNSTWSNSCVQYTSSLFSIQYIRHYINVGFYHTTAANSTSRTTSKHFNESGAESHPEAEHLYIEKVDVGEPETRTIVSGLAKYVSKEDLKDKRVVVVANLKSSRFRGVLSQGMLLASSSQDQSIVDLLSVPSDSVNGERVHLQGLETLSTPDPVLKPKQKVFEQIAQHLLTDKDGVATYTGVPLMTKAGPVASKIVKLGQVS
ncbi:unnamed protein product [Absidia cylindrospora]